MWQQQWREAFTALFSRALVRLGAHLIKFLNLTDLSATPPLISSSQHYVGETVLKRASNIPVGSAVHIVTVRLCGCWMPTLSVWCPSVSTCLASVEIPKHLRNEQWRMNGGRGLSVAKHFPGLWGDKSLRGGMERERQEKWRIWCPWG